MGSVNELSYGSGMVSRVLVVTSIFLLASCSGGGSNTGTPSTSAPVGAQAPLPPVGPGESLLQLAWQPNSDGVVAGYRVYYGPTGDEATTQASDLSLAAANFNAQAPAVVYNAQRDLGLVAGQNVCFRLRAYNGQGALSAWSTPVCASI